jgi:leader peptidase (prepilin peptidase)/N-methyltransferase
MFSLTVQHYHPALLVSMGIISFVMGATIGSFLNVVIYRIPLGLSVNEPRRSFCPNCKYQIPMWLNLPLISWLSLRGKCASCKCEISPRYIIVEFLTGVVFLLVFLKFPFPDAIAYWAMLALFISTVYIDIDHYIIPDQITKGGMVAAFVFAALVPTMFLEPIEILERGPVMSRLWSVGYSLLGAAAGYASLWIVVQLGKAAFGRKKEEFEVPVKFKIEEFTYDTGECEPVMFYEDNDASDATDGDEKSAESSGEGTEPKWEKQPWSEIFSRKSDKMLLSCPQVNIDGRQLENAELTFFNDRIEWRNEDGGGSETLDLEKIEFIEGACSKVVIPREAMGWGDVKFIGMSGAFLGWQSVFFTIVSASLLGSTMALAMSIAGKREWAAKIPFGPYLVFGASLWLFCGHELVEWYWNLTTGGA